MLVFSRWGGRVLAATHKMSSRASKRHASENASLRPYWVRDVTDSSNGAGWKCARAGH
jgi:hypothetical protein